VKQLPKCPSIQAVGSPYQLRIQTPEGTWFASMWDLVAFVANDGHVTLDPGWNRTQTTVGYLACFLGDRALTAGQIRERIESGEYSIQDLDVYEPGSP